MYSRGFVICGDNAEILVFEKSEEVKNPFYFVAKLPAVGKNLQSSSLEETGNIRRSNPFHPKLMAAVMKSRVLSMTMNSQENTLVFSTDNN